MAKDLAIARDTPGLTNAEASRRLAANRPNSFGTMTEHRLARALAKFGTPVPWMREAAIALQSLLGDDLEAVAVEFLLVFNAALGFVQDGGARATPTPRRERQPI